MPPMMTRRLHEGYTMWRDGNTMASRRGRWTHEGNTNIDHRVDIGDFFGIPKIFQSITKVLPNPAQVSRWKHEGPGCQHECPDGYTITPDVAKMVHRVSIGGQHRDSVTPALPFSTEFFVNTVFVSKKVATQVLEMFKYNVEKYVAFLMAK